MDVGQTASKCSTLMATLQFVLVSALLCNWHFNLWTLPQFLTGWEHTNFSWDTENAVLTQVRQHLSDRHIMLEKTSIRSSFLHTKFCANKRLHNSPIQKQIYQQFLEIQDKNQKIQGRLLNWISCKQWIITGRHLSIHMTTGLIIKLIQKCTNNSLGFTTHYNYQYKGNSNACTFQK